MTRIILILERFVPFKRHLASTPENIFSVFANKKVSKGAKIRNR